MGIIECAVGCQGDVAFGRQQNVDLDATSNGFLQCFIDGRDKCEVGVDDVDGVLGIVNGIDIEVAHHFVGGVRLTIYYTDGLVASRCSGIGFQVLHLHRVKGTEIFG